MPDRHLELDLLYRTAPVGLGLLDRELRYVRINDRLARINGKPVSAHIGRTVREVIPDLAVEVVSPHDTQKHLQRKVLHYLDHGVRAVWVVDPASETVTVYFSRQDIRILSKDDEISAPNVLPGFSCRVARFFD